MQNRMACVWILIVPFGVSAALAEDGPATTRAATTQSRKESAKPQTQPVAEKLSVTEHEMKVGEQTLTYKATAGTMPLKDEAGKARANFFFAAYERHSDVPVEKRPITFVFNGGPGAAAIWLHLGTAGPKR